MGACRLKLMFALVFGLVAAAARGQAQDIRSPTMEAVKQRGQLVCGVESGIPGYAFQDTPAIGKGWTCRSAARLPMQCWVTPTR